MAVLEKEKFGVDERWTAGLAQRGFTPISNVFLENYHRLNPPLTHGEAMFLVHLIRYKWGVNAPYPGFKTLAGQMGISPAMARAHARNIEGKKYLFRRIVVGDTNRFELAPLFQALEALTARDAKRAAAAQTPEVISDADSLSPGNHARVVTKATERPKEQPAKAIPKPTLKAKKRP